MLFAVIIGAAALFDSCSDNDQVQLDELTSKSTDQDDEQNIVYFYSQFNVPTAKVELQKPTFKKIQPKLHDRFIQKYHQVRNYQVLKAELEPKTSPLISGYHYLAFKNYYFSESDDDLPLIS
jgi:hypothetical protein